MKHEWEDLPSHDRKNEYQAVVSKSVIEHKGRQRDWQSRAGSPDTRACSGDRAHGGTEVQAAALAQFLVHGEDTRHGVQESLPGVLGPSGKGKNYSTLGAHREKLASCRGKDCFTHHGHHKAAP